MFGRILCPLDFNDNSLAALQLSAQLAKRDQATLYVMHLIEIVEEMAGAAPVVFQKDEQITQSELEKIAESQLAEINHRIILRYGNPAEQIVAAEIELGAELVVMATHGRTGVSRFFFGSVAEKVVRESSCSVLTVRMGFLQPTQA
jgi:nucleotide-binding universal stress UspA family protein